MHKMLHYINLPISVSTKAEFAKVDTVIWYKRVAVFFIENEEFESIFCIDKEDAVFVKIKGLGNPIISECLS
ncbi:MAG TPA: hypothetical protein GX717_04440 [Clostridiaceae bacterium]|nr:hypothetical protein [Clostridiaceae bacterium]